ncbi:hypothetical protein [Salininema proteolyticum]|uniref:Preprotein translocase subunit SecD n=1 Tax=Salininema proteolyticum TaxID=1607685 RepID=A0ABV8TW17_9ACTN
MRRMPGIVPGLAALLFLASCSTPSGEVDGEPAESTAGDPDDALFQFRLVEDWGHSYPSMADGESIPECAPAEADGEEASTVEEVWDKVGPEAAELAQSLTYPMYEGYHARPLLEFCDLTPREAQLLPADVLWNVPHVTCDHLTGAPREVAPDEPLVTCLGEGHKGSDDRLLLRPALFDRNGVNDVYIVPQEKGDYSVEIILNEEAAEALTGLIEDNAVNPQTRTAFVIDGIAVATPVVFEPMGEVLFIREDYTEEEALAMVDLLNGEA